MQLWTWQSKGFDLADQAQKVRSLGSSVYTMHPQLNPGMKDKHRGAYEKLFQRLGTDQLIWCFHRYEDATNHRSIDEFEILLGHVLWEIDVPCEKITWYCDAAWACLRTGQPGLPRAMNQIYEELKYLRPDLAKRLEADFMAYWRDKNDEEVLDLLFVNRLGDGCPEAMVFHPLDTIVKNPLLSPKWWSPQPSPPTKPSLCNDPVLLPCPDCSDRRL